MTRHTASIVILALLLTAGSIVASFAIRMTDSAAAGNLPPTAVVFTGQFDRITRGLDLMASGQVQRLFISGVNAGAGIDRMSFAQQFKLSEVLEAQLKAGNIILAPQAQDTLENGCETARWLAQHPDVRSVLLITSRPHMPRATIALARATEFRLPIERLSVDNGNYDVIQTFIAELLKYTKTLLVSFLPEALWPEDRSGLCQEG